MTALEIKLAIAASLLALCLAMTGWFAYHERVVGAATLQHSVDQATLEAQRKANAQTAQLNAKAAVAAQESFNAQKQLADYMADHPVGAVFVCHDQGSGSTGVPPAATVARAPTGGPTPAGGVQPVPASAPGPDIGPGLALILRAAQQLAVDEAEFQRR